MIRERIRIHRLATALCASVALLSPYAAAQADPAEEARQILAATGVKGGLVVHIGCGDGRLTAALRE